MIKIGAYRIDHPKANAFTMEERLRMTKAAGFDFVSFGAQSLINSTAFTVDLCEKVGIGYDNVHLTGNGTTKMWAEGDAGDEITERYCREIADIAALGVKIGITHVTWGTHTPAPISEVGLRRFERVVEAAEKHDFILALENSVFPEYLHYVMSNLKSEHLGFCFDSGHRNAFTVNEDFFTPYGNILCATHMDDNDGKRDLHFVPYDGTCDFDRVCRDLAGTAHGRDRICAEMAGKLVRDCPGMSAAEIRESLKDIAIIDNERLLKIYDGGFEVYTDMEYDEYLDYVYAAMRRIADGIEKASNK